MKRWRFIRSEDGNSIECVCQCGTMLLRFGKKLAWNIQRSSVKHGDTISGACRKSRCPHHHAVKMSDILTDTSLSDDDRDMLTNFFPEMIDSIVEQQNVRNGFLSPSEREKLALRLCTKTYLLAERDGIEVESQLDLIIGKIHYLLTSCENIGRLSACQGEAISPIDKYVTEAWNNEMKKFRSKA